MVNNKDIKVSYRGDGQTTVFPFTFPFIAKEYIHVAIYDSLTQTTVTLTSDYYVDANAKTVIYPGYPPGQAPAEAARPPVLPATSTITIYRQTDIDQLVDLGDKYPLPQIESMSDKLTEILQEHDESLARAIKVPIGDPETPDQKWLNMQTYVSETAASAEAAANSANESAAHANESLSYANESANHAAESLLHAQEAAHQANAAAGYSASAFYSSQQADAAAMRAAASQAASLANLVSRAEAAVAAINEHAVPAWNSSTVYSYPTVISYTDGHSYRCIGENVPAGTTPPSSPLWVRITTRGGDDFWDIDAWGGYMPAEDPTASYSWELDENGGIMPRIASDNTGREAKTVAEEALEAANAATEAANAATEAANNAIEAAEETLAKSGMEIDNDGNVTPIAIPEEESEEP